MPRKIDADWTFDAIEDEILFTRAALEADPDAADLAPQTDDWLGLVDDTRVRDRAARMAEANANALRIIANGRLTTRARSSASASPSRPRGRRRAGSASSPDRSASG